MDRNSRSGTISQYPTTKALTSHSIDTVSLCPIDDLRLFKKKKKRKMDQSGKKDYKAKSLFGNQPHQNV